MLFATALERQDAPTLHALGDFVFVKPAYFSLKRPAPHGAVVSDTVGKLTAAHGENDAGCVDDDNRWLVDEKYSSAWHGASFPQSTHGQTELISVKRLTGGNPAQGEAA